jgi:hypothetical protein
MSQLNLINYWKNKKQPVFNNLQCKLCNNVDYKNNYKIFKAPDMFHAGELYRYQCPKCDVIFGDLRFLNMSKEEISTDYYNLYSFYKEGNTSQYILSVFNMLEFDKSKVYLDWACGNLTDTLYTLNTNGYNVYGYDKYVENHHPKFLKDINQKFDVIYSSNFIEHVINPISDLNEVLDHLASDGKLVMMSAAWEYCCEKTHYHTFFFINRSVKYLCDKLNIIEIYSKKIIFPDGQFTTCKIFKKK